MSERKPEHAKGNPQGTKRYNNTGSGPHRQGGNYQSGGRGGHRDSRDHHRKREDQDFKRKDAPSEPKKREINFDLAKYMNKKVLVTFTGGRRGKSVPIFYFCKVNFSSNKVSRSSETKLQRENRKEN